GRNATDGDSIQLLHAIKRSRDGFMLDMRDRVQRDQLVVRPGDVDLLQLFRVQPVHALNLWDDLVAEAFHVEPVNVISADAGRKIGADLLHIESHGRDLVMVENDPRLRLVDFRVDVTELKYVRLHRLEENVLREFKDSFLVRGGRDDKADRKIVRAGKRFRHDRKHLNRRDSSQFLLHNGQIIFRRRFAHTPGFQHHSPKAAAWICNLKRETSIRNIVKYLPGCVGISDRVINGRIGRRGNDAKDHALI